MPGLYREGELGEEQPRPWAREVYSKGPLPPTI